MTDLSARRLYTPGEGFAGAFVQTVGTPVLDEAYSAKGVHLLVADISSPELGDLHFETPYLVIGHDDPNPFPDAPYFCSQ